jgi:hypothetical protein
MRYQRGKADLGPDLFECHVLRITGWAFYLLAAGLAVTDAYDGYSRQASKTTFLRIIVDRWILMQLPAKGRQGAWVTGAPG